MKTLVSLWFYPVEQRIYSIVRVCYAFAAMLNLVTLWPERYSFFSDEGMVAVKSFSIEHPSIILLFRSPAEIDALFISAFIVMFCLLLGVGSRIAIFLCCLWNVSIHIALGPMSSGFDSVLRVYGFILLISPLPEGWRPGFLRKERTYSALVPVYGLRLMQLQLCAIYWSTVLPKWMNDTWRSGDYLWYFLNSSFSKIPHELSLQYASLLQFFTWGTLLFESTIPLLLICARTRRIALAFGLLFHGTIAVVSTLYLFSVAMLPAYASFLRSADLRRAGTFEKSATVS